MFRSSFGTGPSVATLPPSWPTFSSSSPRAVRREIFRWISRAVAQALRRTPGHPLISVLVRENNTLRSKSQQRFGPRFLWLRPEYVSLPRCNIKAISVSYNLPFSCRRSSSGSPVGGRHVCPRHTTAMLPPAAGKCGRVGASAGGSASNCSRRSRTTLLFTV